MKLSKHYHKLLKEEMICPACKKRCYGGNNTAAVQSKSTGGISVTDNFMI